jgi:hypothetical protein
MLNEIQSLSWAAEELRLISYIHRIFPDERAIRVPDQAHDISAAGALAIWVEARFHILLEFLERCGSDPMPYYPPETLRAIGSGEIKSTNIPASIQIRLAESISRIYTKGLMLLINEIINCSFWGLYAEETGPLLQHGSGWLPWLDDPAARHKIKEIFTAHIREYEWSWYHDTLRRLLDILRGFDSWHPESELNVAQGGRQSHRRADRSESGRIEDADPSSTSNE